MELKLWKAADNYMGTKYNDYYVVSGQSRDSDILEKSNFEATVTKLGGESEDKVIIIRSNHWLRGWVEDLLVHKDATDKVAIAQKIFDNLANYPVLDEDDYYRREYEACLDNIKDSLYQVPDLDNIPSTKALYDYFANSRNMLDNFYPDREQLLDAIAHIAKQEAQEKQLQAGQTVMEIE